MQPCNLAVSNSTLFNGIDLMLFPNLHFFIFKSDMISLGRLNSKLFSPHQTNLIIVSNKRIFQLYLCLYVKPTVSICGDACSCSKYPWSSPNHGVEQWLVAHQHTREFCWRDSGLTHRKGRWHVFTERNESPIIEQWWCDKMVTKYLFTTYSDVHF